MDCLRLFGGHGVVHRICLGPLRIEQVKKLLSLFVGSPVQLGMLVVLDTKTRKLKRLGGCSKYRVIVSLLRVRVMVRR